MFQSLGKPGGLFRLYRLFWFIRSTDSALLPFPLVGRLFDVRTNSIKWHFYSQYHPP